MQSNVNKMESASKQHRPNRLDIFRRHVSKVKDERSSSPLVISNLPALLPSPESCNQTLHGILHSTSLELSNLEHGTNLYKIRHKGKMRGLCWYKRQFTLNLDSSGLGEVTQDSTKIQRRNNFRLFCLDPIPDQLRFNLNEISNILPGQQTRTFKKLVKLTDKKENGEIELDKGVKTNILEAQCFSIQFKDRRQSLHIIAESKAIRDEWIHALTRALEVVKDMYAKKQYELYLEKLFDMTDKDSDGRLTYTETLQGIKEMGIQIENEQLLKIFDDINKGKRIERGRQYVDKNDFLKLFNMIRKAHHESRNEITTLEKIFFQYATKNLNSGGNKILQRINPPKDPCMGKKDLKIFLSSEQKINLPIEECKILIQCLEGTRKAKRLSLDGFQKFIVFSECQDIASSTHRNVVYQDMTRPLSHYWISSSHNTYLLGNQLTGESSVYGYIDALKTGCRCIELDCWDGGRNENNEPEPKITHGWTACTSILFKDVLLNAIKPYAFHASKYPLILSIENHCSKDYQDVMAKYFVEILGDMLYTDKVDTNLDALPSPEDLKGKILIKNYKLPQSFEEEVDSLDGLLSDDYQDSDIGVKSDTEEEQTDNPRRRRRAKTAPSLSRLVNYVQAVKFPGFNTDGNFYEMSSFKESKALAHIVHTDRGKDFVKYNTNQISRIYPDGTRTDSSNFNPLPFWNTGCQMVALNYQTNDKQVFLNNAKFLDNGGSGYILKPEFLHQYDSEYSPVTPLQKEVENERCLNVTVLSGQFLPGIDGNSFGGDKVNPFVKVRIRGHSDDSGNKGKTDHVMENGLFPVWNQKFSFCIKVPSLSFLEFRVKSKYIGINPIYKDQNLGAFSCPLSMVQEGYRRVILKSYQRTVDISPASLLVHIEFVKQVK